MGKLIVLTGKGGTGKTLISAGLIKYFSQLGLKVLGIDADPDSNLAQMLGHELELSLGQVREQLLDQDPSMDRRTMLEYLMMRCLIEHRGYDLITMGRSEGPGCYCAVNHLLRELLDRLIGNYQLAIMDCQAGLEQLSRRTIRDVDALLIICEPSLRSLQTGSRIRQLSSELKLRFHRIYLVINKLLDPAQLEQFSAALSELGAPILEQIPYDSQLARLDMVGASLNSLSSTKFWDSIQSLGSKLAAELNLSSCGKS